MIDALLPLLGGFLLTLVFIPPLIRLARRCGVVDNPTHRKIHEQPTPYLGGLGIVQGLALAAIGSWLWFNRHAPQGWEGDARRMALILGPVLVAVLLGLVDDVWVIRAKYKLLVQLAIAFAFAWLSPGIEIIRIPALQRIELNDLSVPFTVFWMLGLINGVNLIDGVDGLAGSVCAVILGGIAVLAWHLHDTLVLLVALGGIGALSGFLIYNWRPAKIYMGDAGSLAVGTLLCTLLLSLRQEGATNGEEPFPYQLASISLLAIYPILEITLSVFRRLLTGKPIGTADKGHIHHRLLKQNWSAPMVCGFGILLSVTAATTVILGQLHYHGYTAGLLMFGGLLLGVLLHFCGFLEELNPNTIATSRPHFLIANHFISMQRIKLQQAANLSQVELLIQATCIEFGVNTYRLELEPEPPAHERKILTWNRPETARGSVLLPYEVTGLQTVGKAFSDKLLSKHGSRAAWTFETLMHEEEIDVEYHVLVHDFMSRALRRAEAVQRSPLNATDNGLGVHAIGSNVLSKRGKPLVDSKRFDSLRLRAQSKTPEEKKKDESAAKDIDEISAT